MRFNGVVRVILEHVTILFDKGAAATGGLNDGFGALLNVRPPGINVGAHARTAIVLGIKVEINGATATGVTLMPSRSRIRVVAALVLGDSPG